MEAAAHGRQFRMKPKFAATPLAALLLSTVLSAPLAAQTTEKSAPLAVPVVPGVPDARDLPYPGGTMLLDIDASDTLRGAYRVT